MQDEQSNISLKLTIIYTESNMLLSKKSYSSWREVQDEYRDYKASFENWCISDVIDYLVDGYYWQREKIFAIVHGFIADANRTQLVL